jgi:hypothetical protein
MISANLQGVADQVIRRAQRQGYVVPREVRELLVQFGLSDGLWKEVLALASPALKHRRGRYYYHAPVSPRVAREQSHQSDIRQAIRHLIRERRIAASRVERREQDRIDFIQPVEVRTEDGRNFTMLSRDLSTTGIRLIGTRRLLGQKVHVLIPDAHGAGAWSFLVRILWTCPVGEDLIENGGAFLEVNTPSQERAVEG